MKAVNCRVVRFLLGAVFFAAVVGEACAGSENSAAQAQTRNEWMEAHEGFVERAKQGKVGIVFLGDSITDRWRSAGKEVWAERYAPLNAVNFGIGGDRTENVLWRVRNGELDGISPKVVVLLAGTNNIKRNSPVEIAEGVAAIVSEIRKRTPEAKILLLGVFPRDEKPESDTRKKVAEINKIIAGLDDGSHVFFLDIGSKFLQPDGVISPEAMKDFLHPEKSQYRVWADAMQPKLDELLR